MIATVVSLNHVGASRNAFASNTISSASLRAQSIASLMYGEKQDLAGRVD
jgi:hypothetical protein